MTFDFLVFFLTNVDHMYTQLQDPFILSSMHLNIAERLLDLDTHGNINRETRHLFENMLPYNARY